MNVLGSARRRREKFEDLIPKIIKNMKKIDENHSPNPKKFPGPSDPGSTPIRGGWKLNRGVS